MYRCFKPAALLFTMALWASLASQAESASRRLHLAYVYTKGIQCVEATLDGRKLTCKTPGVIETNFDNVVGPGWHILTVRVKVNGVWYQAWFSQQRTYQARWFCPDGNLSGNFNIR